MSSPGRKRQKYPLALIKEVDSYFEPILSSIKNTSLSKQEKNVLARLIYESLIYLKCLIKSDNNLSSLFEDSFNINNPSAIKVIKTRVKEESSIDNNLREEILFIIENINQSVSILVDVNLRLLRQILLTMLSKNPTRFDEEIASEGVWAVINSIYCYNPYKGIELSTYIAWWVKSLVGALLDKRRYAKQAHDLPWFRRYTSIFGRRSFAKIVKLDSEPSLMDLERLFGVKLFDFFQSLSEKPDIVSIHDTTSIETNIEDHVPDPKTTDDEYFHNNIVDNNYASVVKDIVSSLGEEDARLIYLYFGFDGRRRSYYDVAKEVGKSFEYVRKRIKLLLEVFKVELERRNFTKDDL